MLGVNPNPLPSAKAKGFCGIFIPYCHMRKNPHIFQMEGSKEQLHEQFKCELLSTDFSLDSSLALTPNTSLHICYDCLMSFYPVITFISVQLPRLPHLSFFQALFTLRKCVCFLKKQTNNNHSNQKTLSLKKLLTLNHKQIKCPFWAENELKIFFLLWKKLVGLKNKRLRKHADSIQISLYKRFWKTNQCRQDFSFLGAVET